MQSCMFSFATYNVRDCRIRDIQNISEIVGYFNGSKSTMQEKVFVNPDHASEVLCQMSELWKEEKFCDASIEIGEHKIEVHKLVLVSASTHLLSMADKISMDAKLEVRLPSDMDVQSINAFLTYLYEGVLHLTWNNVTTIDRVSKLLQMPRVSKFCEEFIQISSMTEQLTVTSHPKRLRSSHVSSSHCHGVDDFMEEEDSKAKIRRIDSDNITPGEDGACRTMGVRNDTAAEINSDMDPLPLKIKTEPLDVTDSELMTFENTVDIPSSSSSPVISNATVGSGLSVSYAIPAASKSKHKPIAPKPQTSLIQVPGLGGNLGVVVPSSLGMNATVSSPGGTGSPPVPMTLITSDGKPVELLNQGKASTATTPAVDSIVADHPDPQKEKWIEWRKKQWALMPRERQIESISMFLNIQFQARNIPNGRRDFICKLCGRRCGQSRVIAEHVLDVHGVTPREVPDNITLVDRSQKGQVIKIEMESCFDEALCSPAVRTRLKKLSTNTTEKSVQKFESDFNRYNNDHRNIPWDSVSAELQLESMAAYLNFQARRVPSNEPLFTCFTCNLCGMSFHRRDKAKTVTSHMSLAHLIRPKDIPDNVSIGYYDESATNALPLNTSSFEKKNLPIPSLNSASVLSDWESHLKSSTLRLETVTGFLDYQARVIPKGKRTFFCKHCSMMFGRSKAITHHLLNIHGVSLRQVPLNVMTADRSTRNLEGESMSLKERLEKHTVRLEPDPCTEGEKCPEQCTPVKKVFDCQFCSLRFSSGLTLAQHLSTVHSASDNSTDKNPVEKIPVKRAKCDMCGYVLSRTCQSKYMYYHKHFKHAVPLPPGLTLFTCTYCAKEFMSKGSLKTHYTQCHNPDNQFVCSFCRMTFREKQNLDFHLKGHTAKQTSSQESSDMVHGELADSDTPPFPLSEEVDIGTAVGEIPCIFEELDPGSCDS